MEFLLNLVPFGLGDNLFTLIVFIVVLSILVFVHEWGHYAAARSVGVHAEAFSVGFGKELWARVDKAGTRWKICLIPLGGYVQMKGEGVASGGKPVKADDAFSSKTVLQRAWVIFAGPLANFVFALVVLCGLMLVGEQRPLAKIGDVTADMPAAIAGLQAGDLIKTIDGIEVEDWEQVRSLVSERAEQQVELRVERQIENPAAGEATSFDVILLMTPEKVEYTNLFGETQLVGRIGALPSGDVFTHKRRIPAALYRGAERTWEIIAGTVKGVGLLITGALGADNLSGPIGIAKMAGDTAEHGLYPLLIFMVVISVNLGLINLFPIPVLDGGHLVLLALEGIFGRPMPEMAQEWLFRIGFAAILFLIAFSTVNDLSRVEWIKNLVADDASVQNTTQLEIQTPTP